MNAFDQRLRASGRATLHRRAVRTVQVNLTRHCNLACRHCHVESSPRRSEALSPEGIERLLALLDASPGVATLDLTGGAPELHPGFRELVRRARARHLEVIDRCNLTVLCEPGQEDLAAFLAQQGVHVIASLPCYTPENVEAQRGRGVFEPSIAALRELNALGYARPGSGLRLDLVYNPVGADLPPDQDTLEARYREQLARDFEVRFDRLLALANVPITRFEAWLERRGEARSYRETLATAFNEKAVDGVMCRDLVSVGHDGRLHDCDFHQALELPLGAGDRDLWNTSSLDGLDGAPITTADHCLACTAGRGSGCGGALVARPEPAAPDPNPNPNLEQP